MNRQQINGLWRVATGYIVTAGLSLGLGCAGTETPSPQQIADVQSANRSASELGAKQNPRAELHLKLAEEQLQQAENAMNDGDDERATGLLMRAKADAELAIALTREDSANTQATKAVEQSDAKGTTNSQLGAKP
jgi:hypothetical protein